MSPKLGDFRIGRVGLAVMEPQHSVRAINTFCRWSKASLIWLVALTASVGCATPSSPHVRSRSQSPSTVVVRQQTLNSADRERVAQYLSIVEAASSRYRVDPTLVLGVIWVESKFNRHARSSAGAKGLMQLMPPTARGLAKELEWRRANSYDPTFNVHAGTYLLSQNLKRFAGRTELALAAYNAGPGSVKRWQREGRSLPKSIQSYVAKVLVAQSYFVAHPRPANPPTRSASASTLATRNLPREPASPPARQRRERNATSLPDVDDPPLKATQTTTKHDVRTH